MQVSTDRTENGSKRIYDFHYFVPDFLRTLSILHFSNFFHLNSGCEGCGESSWTKPLIVWNLCRLKKSGIDRPITMCGVCMDRFKHKQVSFYNWFVL